MKLTVADNSDLPPEVRLELRILIALATILVRNHEAVSVVALPDDLKSCFKQIVCTRSVSADNKEQPVGLSRMDDVKPKTDFTIGNIQRDNDKADCSLGVGTQDTPISPAEGLGPGPAHSLISPCSLPIQLREDMIRDMNMTFGEQLRDQLTKLRNRTMSATSDRLSLDTLEDRRWEDRDDLDEKYAEEFNDSPWF